MPMPTPRLPVVLTVLGAISAMGLAGGVAYQSQDRADPALPSVTIDFRVLTDDGRPVLDLKPDEVELRIDGRPRPISSLRLFGEVSPRAAPPPANRRPRRLPATIGATADGTCSCSSRTSRLSPAASSR